MAIAYRTSLSAQMTDVQHPQFPSGVVAGDCMLLCITAYNGYPLTSVTGGWTFLRKDTDSALNSDANIYWRVAQSGDAGTSFTITLPNNGYSRWAVVAYSGTHATTPIDTSAATVSTSTGTTISAPSVTTAAANEYIVDIFSGWQGSSFFITGYPSTMRESGRSGYDGYQVVCDQAQAVAGASGGTTATMSIAGTWEGQTVALTPASTLTPITGSETGSGAEGIPVIGLVSRDDHQG